MVGKVKVAIVKSSKLGTNCWSAARFCGGRCTHVLTCKYPERDTCKAVAAERKYLKESYGKRLRELEECEKASFANLRRKQAKLRERRMR